MYIPAFWAGVLVTLLTIFGIIIFLALIFGGKKK